MDAEIQCQQNSMSGACHGKGQSEYGLKNTCLVVLDSHYVAAGDWDLGIVSYTSVLYWVEFWTQSVVMCS